MSNIGIGLSGFVGKRDRYPVFGAFPECLPDGFGFSCRLPAPDEGAAESVPLQDASEFIKFVPTPAECPVHRNLSLSSGPDYSVTFWIKARMARPSYPG